MLIVGGYEQKNGQKRYPTELRCGGGGGSIFQISFALYRTAPNCDPFLTLNLSFFSLGRLQLFLRRQQEMVEKAFSSSGCIDWWCIRGSTCCVPSYMQKSIAVKFNYPTGKKIGLESF